MIPAKIIVTGDIPRGKGFIKFGRQQLAILDRLMSFQGLKEDVRTVKPYPDVIVQCWKSHKQQEIFIHVVPPKPSGDVVPPEKEIKEWCPCFPHFSFAQILAVYPAQPGEGALQEDIDNYNEFLLTGRFTYDVEACSTDMYILLEGVYSAGWERYNVDQFVLISVGDDEPVGSFDCERSCLVNKIQFYTHIVCSLHILNGMKPWQSLTTWK